jgi:hypothetical protein
MLTGAAGDLAAHLAVGSLGGWHQPADSGVGDGFHGVAAAAVVPGGMRPPHRQPDAGSHGPGPAPVQGMAQH